MTFRKEQEGNLSSLMKLTLNKQFIGKIKKNPHSSYTFYGHSKYKVLKEIKQGKQ